MADDTSNYGNPFASMFFANDKSLPQSMRQKLAMAMMMKKQAAPKNFGEGLFSIGDSLSDAITMRQMERNAAETEKANRATEKTIIGGGDSAAPPTVSPRSSYAPDDVPLPQDPDTPIVPSQPPAARTVAPQPLPPAAPAVQAPPNIPGVTRMSTPAQLQDFRGQNPLPTNIPLPPAARSAAPPPQAVPPPQAMPPPSEAPADFGDRFGAMGQQSAAPSMPPVMAGDTPLPEPDPRKAAAIALVNQQQQNPTRAVGGPPTTEPPVQVAQAPTPAPVIKQAPPAQTIQKAPTPQQLADPGYVLDPGPAPTPPPTRTPLMQRIEQAYRDAPPGEREGLQERMKGYYEAEQAKVTQAHELWKEQMIQYRALQLKMHEQRAAQRSSQDAAITADLSQQKTRQEIIKGQEPALREEVEGKHIWNPATGTYDPARISNADPNARPAFKGTDAQNKALVNYGRAKIAQEGLRAKPEGSDETSEEALANSTLQSALSTSIPGLGRPLATLRSDAYKQAETHADNFVQAFIRQQSGGAYGPEELAQEARGMLPARGDTPKQIETKREQREQFLNSMASVVGPAGQRNIAFDEARREVDRQIAERRKEKGTAAPKYQEGDQAVWPDKTIRTYRNGAWVKE